jgi:penicillin amidase
VSVRRAFRWLAVALALVAVALGSSFAWWRGLGRPAREGHVSIDGLSSAVTVRFDERAVPHIDAASLVDAACALGWLHANDRLTQMELQRRYIDGRVAEVMGARAIELDVSMRRLRLKRTAQRMLAVLPERSRSVLEAYARGVNAWVESRAGDLPPELVLLGIEPEPWTPADSLGVHMLMAQRLSYSEARERKRLAWLGALGAARTRELSGVAVPIDPEIETWAAELARARNADAHVESKPQNGSNNWAVDASRSESGHALVANDPHLELSLPSIWFQALVRSPEYEASGFTIPGLPLVVIGQGARVAWGFTNTELDVCDVFVERVNEQGTAVLRGSEWIEIEVEREVIHVAGGDDVELELRSTDVGPLHEAGTVESGWAFSIAWTGYELFDPLEPFFALAHARSVDDVPAIAARFVGPPQNIVCGDAGGSILYAVLGRSVERGFGDGRVPVPAWRPETHWKGLAPHAETPSALRPGDALLVTANQDTRPRGFEHAYTVDAAAPQRAQRIRERLAQRRDWTPQALAELQVDAMSLYALQLVRHTPVPSCDLPQPTAQQFDAKRAFDALRAWDGTMSERGASALYALYERSLTLAIFADELRPIGALLAHPEHKPALLAAVRGEIDPAWFDDPRTPGLERRDDVSTRALADAWRAGVQRWGSDVAAWDYASLHAWQPQHRLSDVPLIGRMLDRPRRGVPGSDTSPCVFAGRWSGDDLATAEIVVGHGASLRIVCDAADPDASLAILPGGQAGHPFEAHYDDQLEPYFDGRLAPMRWSEAAIETATKARLTLAPPSSP